MDLNITAVGSGIELTIGRSGEPDLTIPLDADAAIEFFYAWWQALKMMGDNPASEPAVMQAEFAQISVAGRSDGSVRLITAPHECSPISYILGPAEARALAQNLSHSADQVEAFFNPN